MDRFDRLILIADRLAKIRVGSTVADSTIHDALNRSGPGLPYTTDAAAARSLLPPGFEWRDPVYSSGFVYASCRRSGMDGEWPHPHHGQWGPTRPLSMCGAVLRAWAMLAKDLGPAAVLAQVARVTK
jgi:hypothetical protein